MYVPGMLVARFTMPLFCYAARLPAAKDTDVEGKSAGSGCREQPSRCNLRVKVRPFRYCHLCSSASRMEKGGRPEGLAFHDACPGTGPRYLLGDGVMSEKEGW